MLTQIEKAGSSFPIHTKKKHYLWNYIYYLYVLNNKSSTDFTGLEFEIFRQVEAEEIDWFPSAGGGDAEGELKSAFESLEAEMNKVFATMEDSVSKVMPAITDAKEIVTSKG